MTEIFKQNLRIENNQAMKGSKKPVKTEAKKESVECSDKMIDYLSSKAAVNRCAVNFGSASKAQTATPESKAEGVVEGPVEKPAIVEANAAKAPEVKAPEAKTEAVVEGPAEKPATVDANVAKAPEANPQTAKAPETKLATEPKVVAQNADKVEKSDSNADVAKAAEAKAVADAPKVTAKPYKNNLRTMFQNNEAKILAIIPRTFNAKDTNGNGLIDDGEQHGTLLNAIERLDEIAKSGINTFHILPFHPPGKVRAMGTAGSLYSPGDFLKIDPVLVDKNDPRSDKEQFKAFVDACHDRGIKVMIDLPSCASYDMYLRENHLMAKERNGLAKTPQGWNDIRMLQPWGDETKRTLNPELLKLHTDFVDMCHELGADGIRADVARAKPTEFWDLIIPYSRQKDPEFAWLAETYTYEDASPQANMPFDRPEDSLKCGFDSYYGQYHIYNEWSKASELIDFVVENIEMSHRLDKGKSLIGSFTTHDDKTPMAYGGADYCKHTAAIQATLPMLNPYFVDGFQSGDHYLYPYEHKMADKTMTDNYEYTVHNRKLDIFNLSRKPGGDDPSIGDFMTKTLEMRDEYKDIITKGSFIPLNKTNDKEDQIVAYARHLDGKTIVVVGNKNVNRNVTGVVKVPGLKENQELKNLLTPYGNESQIQAANGELRVNLGKARAHVFVVDTPMIEAESDKVYKQNL